MLKMNQHGRTYFANFQSKSFPVEKLSAAAANSGGSGV